MTQSPSSTVRSENAENEEARWSDDGGNGGESQTMETPPRAVSPERTNRRAVPARKAALRRYTPVRALEPPTKLRRLATHSPQRGDA